MTIARWPWKSALSKQLVTKELSKNCGLKMDGTEAKDLYSTALTNIYVKASSGA